MRTLFGRDEADYDDSDDTFDYYMNYEDADSDLEDYLRNYEDYDDDEDSYLEDDDDEYNDDYDDFVDDDDEDEEKVDRPDNFVGAEQLFEDADPPMSAKAPVKPPPAKVADIICSLCDEEETPVKFHPCQHKVCCLDCSIRLKKCPKCKGLITKKEKWDGQEVELKSAVKYTDLLERLHAQEETKKCQICFEKPKNTVFGCGHFACQDCAKVLNSCHFCRKKIQVRTKVFEL